MLINKITDVQLITRSQWTGINRARDVLARFSDGTTKTLFAYFPDEGRFDPKELLGLTQVEAMQLYCQRFPTGVT